MIVKPRIRGFICTTAHPEGCAANVLDMVRYVKEQPPLQNPPKNVLVIGSSTGYGLASRVAYAFGGRAASIGVFFEKPGMQTRTGTAGYYNNRALEEAAKKEGIPAYSVNGDAFSNAVKEQVIDIARTSLEGKIDLVIYSLASPRRQDPTSGILYSSAIKPIGKPFCSNTVDFHSGVVSPVEVSPASEEEIEGTIKVMGGEDWELWMKALREAGVLAEDCRALAYSYIGPELTHAVYTDGTIGRAKADLERAAGRISELLGPAGHAFVSVNKALVTQSSSAIPVVPLYIALLYAVMKERGLHEDCIRQMARMAARLDDANWRNVPVDGEGRLRMDDWEMQEDVQGEVLRRWEGVTTENLSQRGDLEGYRADFLALFGFGRADVDYEADVATE